MDIVASDPHRVDRVQVESSPDRRSLTISEVTILDKSGTDSQVTTRIFIPSLFRQSGT